MGFGQGAALVEALKAGRAAGAPDAYTPETARREGGLRAYRPAHSATRIKAT